MKNVNCKRCNKEYEVNDEHFYKNTKYRNGNFYCSKECLNLPIEERFWAKVNKTDNIEDCWEWFGRARSKFGYGRIKFENKIVSTHRLSWMMFNNNYEITSKDFVCHKCDNPKCVNPHHLFLGDDSINMKDAVSKNRVKPPKNPFLKGREPKNKSYTKENLEKANAFIKENPNIRLKDVSEMFNIKYQALRDSRKIR